MVSKIVAGDLTPRVDYASQTWSLGPLRWAGIDFGEQITLGRKLRAALSVPGKYVRNQCFVLHLEAAYAWFLQGAPADRQ